MTTRNDKNRVLKQSELIAKDLDTIYEPIINKIVSAAIRGDIEAVNRYAANGKKDLSRYVLEQRHEDYFNGQRVGVVAGRKEALAVMETVIGEDDATGLHIEDTVRNGLRVEQRTRLSQAVAALQGASDSPSEPAQPKDCKPLPCSICGSSLHSLAYHLTKGQKDE